MSDFYSIEIHPIDSQSAGYGRTYQSPKPLSEQLDIIQNSDAKQSINQAYTSYDQVLEMIERSMSNLKVYVVESDISDAQNAVKTVVEQASF